MLSWRLITSFCTIPSFNLRDPLHTAQAHTHAVSNLVYSRKCPRSGSGGHSYSSATLFTAESALDQAVGDTRIPQQPCLQQKVPSIRQWGTLVFLSNLVYSRKCPRSGSGGHSYSSATLFTAESALDQAVGDTRIPQQPCLQQKVPSIRQWGTLIFLVHTK